MRANPEQLQSLETAIGSNYAIYAGTGRPSNDEYEQVFWNSLMFNNNATESGSFELSSKDSQGRQATWVILEHKTLTDIFILVINTHFINVPQDADADEAARRIEIQRDSWTTINTFAQTKETEFSNNNDNSGKKLLTFAIGDFNVSRDSDLYNEFFDSNNENTIFVDCMTEFGVNNLNVNYTTHTFEGLEKVLTPEDNTIIDWILVSKNTFENYVTIENMFIGVWGSQELINNEPPNQYYVSDHFPVYAECKLK